MTPISIQLQEQHGLNRHRERIRCGVPIARSQVHQTEELTLTSMERGPGQGEQEETTVPCDVTVTGRWPDGSLRWVLLEFLLDLDARQSLTLQLKHHQGPALQADTPSWPDNLQFDDNQPGWRFNAPNNDQRARCSLVLESEDGTQYRGALDTSWALTGKGLISRRFHASGHFLDPRGEGEDKTVAHFRCRLELLDHGRTLAAEICLHNPRRARHSGGLWDLGDEGSLRFRSLALHVDRESAERPYQVWLKPTPLAESRTSSGTISLLQESSGFDNWHSRNHIGADGVSRPRFRGFRVNIGNQPPEGGDQASPILGFTRADTTLQASLERFWQNFPSRLGADSDGLVIELFPGDTADCHELQGGERKTRTAYLHWGNDTQALDWTQQPLRPVLEPAHVETCQVFPHFQADARPGALEGLIRRGLDPDTGFLAKRKIIDEYGWRNFGDLFADHETLYQEPGEPPLISHYNNQYDAIQGFARQFALSGDQRWHELMDDLACHVTDIDIYHTREDRSEYNNGLFWHTDHYLDAHTATHRTFSQHNHTSSTPGQTGGGPAAEHCYTSGLLYHYYLTGNDRSRDAVLELAEWMVTIHEGQGGLLEQLLALKKHDVPKLKDLLKGKTPLKHRYPFTRGTGNYLNALLDAWLLTGEPRWLARCESVIQGTIHPDDDLAQRDLLDVETGWSYLVLLASLVKYLNLKRQFDRTDGPYQFALSAFRHYAQWMRTHERPFLEDPEPLEFANDTWVAQDIRKAMLMYQAGGLFPDQRTDFLAQGKHWLDQVTGTLTDSPEAHFTRILVILMQNHGPHQQPLPVPCQAPEPNEQAIAALSTPVMTWSHLLARMTRRLISGIVGFRPAREKAWLNARLDRS